MPADAGIHLRIDHGWAAASVEVTKRIGCGQNRLMEYLNVSVGRLGTVPEGVGSGGDLPVINLGIQDSQLVTPAARPVSRPSGLRYEPILNASKRLQRVFPDPARLP